MNAALRLERLPKATKHLTFISTPGSIGSFAFARSFNPQRNVKSLRNRSVPWQKGTITQIPLYQTSSFTLKAIPMTHLEEPQNGLAEITPLIKRHKGRPKSDNPNSMTMSVQFISSKELRGSFIRQRIKRKIRNAFGIACTRGTGRELGIDMKDGADGAPRPLQDWTYIVTPTLAVYRLPSVELIHLVRKAMTVVNNSAVAIDMAKSQLSERRKSKKPDQRVDEDAQDSHDKLSEPDSGEEVQAVTEPTPIAEDILSPKAESLPVWARPDFVAQQEFGATQKSQSPGSALRNFSRRIFRSEPILSQPKDRKRPRSRRQSRFSRLLAMRGTPFVPPETYNTMPALVNRGEGKSGDTRVTVRQNLRI